MRVRRPLAAVWLALWPLLIGLSLGMPIRTPSIRAALLLGAGLLWIGALALLWPRRTLRRIGLGVTLAGLLWLCLPGRPDESDGLRAAYIRALASYENTPYVWGGETHRGIDCSGLVRCALVDAELRRGLATANPRGVRAALSLWWHDRTAADLGQSYRGETVLLGTVPSLNAAGGANLRPGDIAVTRGGGHTLAYLGDRRWIEADPNALVGDKTVIMTVPSQEAWFREPMRILRWRVLTD